MKALSAFLDLLFPKLCIFCRRPLYNTAELYCGECYKSLPRIESGDELLLEGNLTLYAPFWYEEPIRSAIRRMKFHSKPDNAKALAGFAAECIGRGKAFDVITWAPVSDMRKRQRGYDQSRLLAGEITARLKLPLLHTLDKIRDTKPQSGLDADERARNVSGCYAARIDLSGAKILLIDDICTTGATLRECVNTLKRAGAGRVECAVIAKTRRITDFYGL